MKKYIKIACLTAASALTLTSCGDDFLDKGPSSQISTLQLAENVKDRPYLLEGSLRGIYKTIYDKGTGGTSGHYDFGQKAYDVFSDMLSQDMVLSVNTYGWYGGISNMTVTTNYTSNVNYIPWRYYYRLIYACNLILESSKDENGNYHQSDANKSNIGQALAIRGYSYFMLANYYFKDFNSGDKILPVYLEPSGIPQVPKTAAEVLDVSIADLELAVDYLTVFNRSSKYEISQDIAKVMLSYAYGAKGDDTKAYQQIKTLVSGGLPILGKDLVAYNSTTKTGNGFNNVASDNWMWGQDITLDDNLDLISWWGQMDYFTYSYAAFGDRKAIDENLYNQIPDTDVRKNWFEEDSTSDLYLMPLNKFYAPERVFAGQRNITTDYVYMRTEEVYLLAAEFAAKTGDEAMAKQYLKTLLTERVADPSYVDALSGDALLKEILLQTRIEMWGEGKSYLLMKRNKSTVTRGANHLSFQGQSYSYNDERLTFEVPQKEKESNPNY